MIFFSAAAGIAHLVLVSMHRFGDRFEDDPRDTYRQVGFLLLSLCCFPFAEGDGPERWLAIGIQATVLAVAVALHRRSPQRWDN